MSFRKIPFRWHELATIALAVSLAWGLRGQHGHERGGALAGAMTGLAIAAATGGPAWVGAAMLGSLGFAIGGALSYGKFVQLASQGSPEAAATLALVGASWGGFGGLGLGLGLSFFRYRRAERFTIGLVSFLTWVMVDHVLWARMTGPEDLATRRRMALIMLYVLTAACAYLGLVRRDRSTIILAAAGAAGFAAGFPLAAYVQNWGPAMPLDWWRTSEHLIGLCGGLSIGLAALFVEKEWRLPRPVGPWERWAGMAWLLWLLPTWLIANNMDYWISEKTLLPVAAGKVGWGLLLAWLVFLAVWGVYEIRQGKLFVTSWMPRQLRVLFLSFLWLSTLIASSKTFFAGAWSLTPVLFLLLATVTTVIVKIYQPKLPA